MADLVGEAFVRITADTTQMRRAIRRAGQEDGAEYLNAFTKEVETISDTRLRRAQTALASAISDPKDFDRLAKNFGSTEEAAKSFREMLVDLHKQQRLNKGSLTTYTAAVNKWEKATIKANKATLDATLAEEAANKATADRNKSLNNFFRLQGDGYKRLQVSQRASAKAAEKFAASLDKTNVSVERHSNFIVNGARNMRIALDKVTGPTDRFGIVVGRAFGKGSRNNFLNWTGSMVAGLTRLSTGIFTFPLRALSHIGDTFGTVFSASRLAGVGKLASAGKALLAVFGGKGGLIGAMVGVVAGAFAFGKVLPGVISLMTSLGGVVSALVGSTGIGLVAALLAVGPAAAGALAGLGGVFGAIDAFAKQEKYAEFFKSVFETPFANMNAKHFPEVKTFLENIKGGFQTLLDDISPSITTFFDTFKTKMNDPSTRSAARAFSESLGRMASTLNGAATSFFSGLLGFFEPVLPYAERLARYIADVATNFDRWANSAGGQNSIATFMANAWENGKKVFDILGSITGIFGSVFTGGDETGMSFLEGIRLKLEEIDGYLKTDAGKAKMDEWFTNVKGIGEDLGVIATNVGKVIAAFSSPEGQANAKALMDALVGISGVAVGLARVADDIGRIVGFLTTPAVTLAMSVLNSIRNGGGSQKAPPGSLESTLKPATPDFGPISKEPIQGPTVNFGTSINGDKFTGPLSPALGRHLDLTPGQEKELARYVVPVNMEKTAYEQTKAIVEGYKFSGKQVSVDGNETSWNAVKGTVAGYAFDPKTVKINADASDVRAAVESAKRYLSTLPATKRIRIAGVNSVGGITLASGGMFNGATQAIIGEAGPEAVVPLNRPLHLVDPAVRALSAFAQGMKIPKMASGGVAGGGRTINVHPGAIVVQSPHSNPALVAEAVIDRLVSFA